jgi:hypothetical protein
MRILPSFTLPTSGLDVTADGTIYGAVTGCRRVVKITPDGKVETTTTTRRAAILI